MKKEKSKYVDSEYVIISTCLIMSILAMLVLAFFDDGSFNIPEEPKHECTHFEKVTERIMVTPFYYRYEDVLKCIECGQEYEN